MAKATPMYVETSITLFLCIFSSPIDHRALLLANVIGGDRLADAKLSGGTSLPSMRCMARSHRPMMLRRSPRSWHSPEANT
jgi:hypothetical protein